MDIMGVLHKRGSYYEHGDDAVITRWCGAGALKCEPQNINGFSWVKIGTYLETTKLALSINTGRPVKLCHHLLSSPLTIVIYFQNKNFRN